MDLKILIHQAFRFGILLKGLDAVLEMIGGVLLLIINPEMLNRLVMLLTFHELSEDPHDLIANFLINSAHDLSVSALIFGSLYLLSHGLIKIFLVVSLWREKLWAYPVAIFFFSLFIIYQIYRYLDTYSIWLIPLAVFDLIIVILTWLEFKFHLNLSHKSTN